MATFLFVTACVAVVTQVLDDRRGGETLRTAAHRSCLWLMI